MGREEELEELEAAFDRVKDEGAPHLVTLVGEAGVGKSRVLRELESLSPPAPTLLPSTPGAVCPTAAESSSGLSAR